MTDIHRFDAPGPPRLPDGFDVPFAEAIAWARERKAVLPDEFYGARLQAVRARSFTVTGLAALDQVQSVADSLADATAQGQTLREWQKTLGPEAFSLGKARRELIFRNAVQTNYGIGRTIQQRENAAARGYLMWDAINDSRTRESHRAMDGHIAPIDAPVWRVWNAPAGHRCRCTRIALTEAQARARGYPKGTPNAEPDSGWEGDPTEGNDDLVRIVRAKYAKADPGIVAAVQALPPPKPTFMPQKSVKAAAEYAVKANLADFADYTGIKPEVANAWNESLFNHLQEFPALRSDMKFTGTAQAQFSRWREIEIQRYIARLQTANPHLPGHDFRPHAERFVKAKKVGNQYAHSWSQPDVSGIVVNKKFGASAVDFEKSIARDAAKGHFPPSSTTIKSVADHEMGHALDHHLGLKNDPEIKQAFTEALRAGMQNEVSRYAATNIEEFIAECWTESVNSAAPRSVSKNVSGIIRRRYRDKYP